MIQELLFGGSSSTTSYGYLGAGDMNKALISNNNNGGIIIADATTAATTENPGQNLRCPRCDSSNTKFCYYNNYNLTQPRHFCKTCRRYWTKGGALRNVPIGGGCRKNKTTFTGKPKVSSSSADILLKSGILDPKESSSHHPIMWSSPTQPQTSHLLAFLRSTQGPNPSNHTHLISSSPLQSFSQAATGFTAMNMLNGQNSLSGYEYPSSSFLGNKNRNLTLTQPQHPQFPPQQHYEVAQRGGVQQNSGIQEFYQRMILSTRSNTNSFNSGGNDTNHAKVVLGNEVSVSASPASSRPGLESAPVMPGGGGSDSGQWNIPAGEYSTRTNDHLPATTSENGCGFSN